MNRLKDCISGGGVAFGFWSMIPSPMVAHVLGSSGADFVIADLEHGNASLETLESFVYAVQSAGATPVCRLPRTGPEDVLRVLELGLQSVMMSHISSVGEAHALVSSCLYPPLGDRGLSPFTAVHSYDGRNLEESMRRANTDMFIGALLEGESALEDVGAIAATPGLDMVYLGLFDIASSTGHADNPDHPDVRRIMARSVDLIRGAGKCAGTVARDPESLKSLLDLGFQFIGYRNDTALLMQACRRAVHEFRSKP